MLRAMIENCCRPRGVYGRLMLRGMNAGHGPMARWRWTGQDRGRAEYWTLAAAAERT